MILRGTGSGSVLVFTRTKHRARRVAQQLQRAGFAAAELQGNLSQNRRQAALDGFRDGTHRIGRTGRAERSGQAYTLVTPDDAVEVRAVEKVLGCKVERRTLAGFDYGTPPPVRDRDFEREPRPVRRPHSLGATGAGSRSTPPTVLRNS